MKRKLKDFGLALAGMLALSGLVGAVAHAETPIESTLASPGVTTVDLTNDTNEHGKLARLTFGNGARFIECTSLKVSGATIVGSATAVTGTPEFNECFSNGLTSAPADPTVKCKAQLAPRGDGSVGITWSCEVIVHIFENVKAQEEKKSLCQYDIPGQTVSGGVLKNAGGAGTAMDITGETAKVSKLKEITNTGSGGLAVCGLAVNAKGEGSLSGNVTISGTNSEGKAVGVTLA